jgi:hypothetical protein
VKLVKENNQQLMTNKELQKGAKQLKRELELQEQNNKWNKILAVASVVSALMAVFNFIVALLTLLNYLKRGK